MRCAHCGREFPPRRRWLRSKAWCSGACRRRMTAEAREVMLWVARWGSAVRRPDTTARYDELVPRFVAASIRPPMPPRPPRASHPFVDLGELPLDEPDGSDRSPQERQRSGGRPQARFDRMRSR